jgi:hypothetical protein
LVQLACHPFINWKGMKIHSEQKKKECRMMWKSGSMNGPVRWFTNNRTSRSPVGIVIKSIICKKQKDYNTKLTEGESFQSWQTLHFLWETSCLMWQSDQRFVKESSIFWSDESPRPYFSSAVSRLWLHFARTESSKWRALPSRVDWISSIGRCWEVLLGHE